VTGKGSASAFDRPLGVLWAASSAMMLLIYGLALFGFVKPHVVIPQWLLDAPAEVRGLALHHEREHVDAKDNRILALARALCALAPWNLVLWWQLRRLRAAIEIDCDARVLRGGVDAKAYSSALLAVRQRHAATPLAAVALLDPVSELERRIRLMLQAPKRASRTISTVGTAITTTLAVCPAPVPCPPMPRTTTTCAFGGSSSP
jgi:beta-lactamase regulating signal transducer with metallopeptidase domain